MSLEQAILEAVRALPPDKQYEILDHATRLRDQTSHKKPLRSVKGLWADLDVSLSAEDIDAARHEMWKISRGTIFDVGRCGRYACDRLVSLQ